MLQIFVLSRADGRVVLSRANGLVVLSRADGLVLSRLIKFISRFALSNRLVQKPVSLLLYASGLVFGAQPDTDNRGHLSKETL